MSRVTYMRGNEAAAEAARLARIQFMGAYPIPPSAEIMERISTFIKDGEMKAGFLEAEGEKGAEVACFEAACSGLRAFNATSSQGLAFMHEVLHLFSGARMPMVMVIANRSLFAPHSMLCDHTDSISQRDTGWLQFYCETVQELLDTVIQGYKISENPAVKLPVMVCEDGFLVSHSLERVIEPSQEEVDAFLPPYRPSETDHVEPGGLSMFTSALLAENWFAEFRYQQTVAELNALKMIEEVDREFGERFGRNYGGLLDAYKVDDAEVVMIGMGSIMATVRHTIDVMRSAGKRVGMVKIRAYRPFPKEKLAAVIGNTKARMVVVIEKTFFGALYDEIQSALYNLKNRPKILGFGVGINGRDVLPENIVDLYEEGFTKITDNLLPQRSELYFIRKREQSV
jgi:pyruvate ferredoxin oxidoreductase alpha subunit